MSTVYAKRTDDKAARREAKYAMQRKQMEILDEDAKLKRLEKDLHEKKQKIAGVKLKMEKIQVGLLALEREQSSLEAKRMDIERDTLNLRGHIRRLEHEAETLRQKAYRGDQGFGG
jgi:chromosome segregation ATPase